MSRPMICLDLDGTLLNQKSKISERNQQALKKCLNEGAAVYFVTGRPYCFTKALALSVDPRIGVVSSSGACYEAEQQLMITPVPEPSLSMFLNCLKHSSVHAFLKGLHHFYTHDAYDERFLYDRMNSWFPAAYQVQSFTDLSFSELSAKAHDIHKILVYGEDKEQLDLFEHQVSKIPGLLVSRYNDISFDVTAAEVDKGRAIQDIRNRLGISQTSVLAIGDAPNDLPMLREAGVPIAMGNAKPEILRFCKQVTASNEEDGVAQVLENLKYYLPD